MHLKQATRFDPPGLALPSCRGLPGVRRGSPSRSRRSTSLGGGLDFKGWMRFQTDLDFRYDIMKFDGSEYAPCQVHETSMYALSTVPILQFT